MDTKSCPKCGEVKSLDDFHRDAHGKYGRTTYCKVCNTAKSRQWTKDNPERAREQGRKRAAAGLNRAAIRKRKYGISPTDYAALLDRQGGLCAICKGSASGRKDSSELCVDHDHTTNQIRGLLCHSCNRGIGMLRDDPDIIQRAADYLRTAPYQP
jgi:hypothetical protein